MVNGLATYHFAEDVSKPPKSPDLSFRVQRSGAEESRPTGLARPIRRDPSRSFGMTRRNVGGSFEAFSAK